MGEVAAGLDLRARQACAPRFDKRPGALEATRDETPVAVAVAGKRDGAHWMVLAIIGGFQVTIRPAVARALAGQLVTYAELAENGWHG